MLTVSHDSWAHQAHPVPYDGGYHAPSQRRAMTIKNTTMGAPINQIITWYLVSANGNLMLIPTPYDSGQRSTGER